MLGGLRLREPIFEQLAVVETEDVRGASGFDAELEARLGLEGASSESEAKEPSILR